MPRSLPLCLLVCCATLAAADGVRFDMGGPSTPLAPGYTRVTPADILADGKAFGWTKAPMTFLFRGEMGRDASARMQQLGFVVTEVKEDTFRLLGKDDDTGHPLVVHIGHSNGLTVVTTFSKDFYDRRAGK